MKSRPFWGSYLSLVTPQKNGNYEMFALILGLGKRSGITLEERGTGTDTARK